ncbi:putative P-loop-containing kinase [Desulfocapsa sulfexigens DSM 10523]|uniref:Putative P-loop-containing kinase n=1 Tax=Desulfocapsa sulfexigens (strain DSM 10523 / SB164P1) TaxID=1167006 RepID=M1PCQ8_DESSD|nr:RNase adapter RapZ [Desulfocapsa sulfexigens]AGF77515.1 putative P-loop-containing kinase [Desulfocapsa sulfexigens DSM 10523]
MSSKSNFPITLFSFGYKYDPPQDVNFLFDVRFLANPFHEKELRSFTGLEASIADFVLNNDSGKECLQQLHRIIKFHANQLRQSGKDELRIGIGCTGGHHRSVAVTEALANLLREDFEAVTHFHRDIKKESH